MKVGALAVLYVSLFLPSTALAAAPSAPFNRLLDVGSAGQDVATLQQILLQQGFLNTTPTSYFGVLTAAAVAKFQTANGIEALGTVGPRSRALLNRLASGSVIASSSIVAASSTARTLTHTLSVGSRGSEVTQLQLLLIQKGYLDGIPTGYYGALTAAAVAKLQVVNKFESVGTVGPKTLAFINDMLKTQAGASVAMPATPSQESGSLRTGGGGAGTPVPSLSIQSPTPPAGGGGGGSGGATTAPADTTPPVITINAPSANLPANTTQAAISVTTNKAAACSYAANASTAYASMTPFTATGNTSHSTTLSGLQNATAYIYYVKCKDAAGNISGNAAVSFSIAAPAAAASAWVNTAFASQSGTFTASFDATPAQTNEDTTVGLSAAAAAGYTDMAAIVRFNNTGSIDVRNGSVYAAGVNQPYAAGTSYHLRLVVTVPAHTYSVYVTPAGASEVALASNYPFRSEQLAVGALSYWSKFNQVGDATISNFAISSSTASSSAASMPAPAADTIAPTTPANLAASAVSASQISLTWTASTDNVGVTGYQVFRNGALIASPATNSYSDTGLAAATLYAYTVKAQDAAGNISPASASASATTQAAPAAATLSGWPDASNTGVPSGVVLTPARSAALPSGVSLDALGNMTITSPGVTINGLDISGTVYVTASNVTIKNSRVRGGDWFLITTGNNATNLTVTDSTLDGTGTNNSGQTCVVATTILRNNMFHCENGATAGDTAGRASLIQDNYIHDLLASGLPHYDGVQEGGPSSNETVNHNTIDMGNLGETGAVNLSNDFGSISNDVISNNRLLGGSYTVYVDNSRVGTISGIKITNNRLKSGQYGYWAVGAGTTAAKCGNVDDTSGAALDGVCTGI